MPAVSSYLSTLLLPSLFFSLQRWDDESQRQGRLDEKHARGAAARRKRWEENAQRKKKGGGGHGEFKRKDSGRGRGRGRGKGRTAAGASTLQQSRGKENRGEAHEASVWDRWEGAMDSPYEMRGMVFEYGGNGPDR